MRTNSTIWRRKAGGYGGLDFGRVDTSSPKGQVSTKSDQLHTYVPTLAGFLYLAIVLDVFSRRVVGGAMAGHLRTELVLDALDMAVEQRRPDSVIHHSDQGCQYTSFAFGERCRRWGVVPSMGSVGDCFDNAMAESFFATLECELLDRTHFHDHHQARRAIFEFIEGWYNPHRRHQGLGQQSPIAFERSYQDAA